jgi:hypothetical protein
MTTLILAGTKAQAALCAIKYDVEDYVFPHNIDCVPNTLDEVWVTGTYYMNTYNQRLISQFQQSGKEIIVKRLD